MITEKKEEGIFVQIPTAHQVLNQTNLRVVLSFSSIFSLDSMASNNSGD